MITVSISINGNPIITRSCWKIKGLEGECQYQCDDGRIIKHNYDQGSVPLAIKLLEGVKE